MSEPESSGFLSRWSRRKAEVRRGALPADPASAPPLPPDPPPDPPPVTPAATAATAAPVTAAPVEATVAEAPAHPEVPVHLFPGGPVQGLAGLVGRHSVGRCKRLQ